MAESINARVLKGRTAAILYGSGGSVGMLAVLLPHWPTVRPLGILVPVAAAYGVVGVLLRWSPRLPDWSFHLLPVAGASLISVALLSTGNEAGASTFAALYVFPSLYAAVVFTPRQAAVHLAWVMTAYAATLVVAPGVAPLVRWVFVLGACGGASAVAGWLVHARDRATEALRDSESSFRLLFANNPHPMWVYDLESLEFVEVNDAAVEKYGWSRDEFARMRITDIRPAQDVPRLLDDLRREHRPQLQTSEGWRHTLRDGTVVDVVVRSHTMTFRGRDVALVVAEDVTERNRAEEALRDAYEREREAAEGLRALDELKNSILHAVSHELRTPLAIVLGIAITLRERGGEISVAMTRDLIERLAANARRLERLLSGLLDLDRVMRGLMEPNREQVDVVDIAKRVAAESELRHVCVEIDEGPVLASVDPTKFERIVENLLVNADRHTPKGTQVWVRANQRDGGVLLTVEDSGPGVPQSLKDTIFDAFSHGGPEHSPGTGIGLSLVSQFAKLHGGRAWLEDRPGGGASFKVLLPAA